MIQIQQIFISQNILIFNSQNIVINYMKIQTSIHPMLKVLQYKRVVPVRALIIFEMKFQIQIPYLLLWKVMKIPMLLIDRVMEEWWYSNDARTSLPQNYIADVQLGTHQQNVDWVCWFFSSGGFPQFSSFPILSKPNDNWILSLVSSITLMEHLCWKPNCYENLIKS